jgi:hypothetical protein
MRKKKSDTDKLLEKHDKLIHSEDVKVTSHVQRKDGDWYINTIMIENVNCPFKFKRKKHYRALIDHRVNITYYADYEVVAGFEIEVMKIVRIKIS